MTALELLEKARRIQQQDPASRPRESVAVAAEGDHQVLTEALRLLRAQARRSGVDVDGDCDAPRSLINIIFNRAINQAVKAETRPGPAAKSTNFDT